MLARWVFTVWGAWLGALGLGIDPAAWDAFLADYFAAAARLVAPFDHVRLMTTFRIAVTRDGRPVLRSFVRTIPAPHQTIRLDVEECRFGPIPEVEFALEPCLASLGPGRPTWQQAVEPSTATLLDWYWLAFVVGGISLAGGSGLALGSRYRDRRAWSRSTSIDRPSTCSRSSRAFTSSCSTRRRDSSSRPLAA
jgi:hypothetical protein